MIYSAFVIGLLMGGDDPPVQVAELPGTKWSVAAIAPSTEQVLSVVAVEPAEIVRRHGAHISTQTAGPGGKMIHGGGVVHYAECKQRFDVREVLHGEAEKGKRTLTYRLVEKTAGFPLPQTEHAVPQKFAGLVLVAQEGRIHKVLADTPENREEISAAFEAAKKDRQAADVALITAWLVGKDDQKVFAGEFGDSKWLTDTTDAILYSDVDGVNVPKGLRTAPYDFVQARLHRIRNGAKASPAVIVTRSVAEEPRQEVLQELKRSDRKPLKGERYYYVEVAFGNMARHQMKVAVGERDGKLKAEILWRKVS